jgi:hypothetical protein
LKIKIRKYTTFHTFIIFHISKVNHLNGGRTYDVVQYY